MSRPEFAGAQRLRRSCFLFALLLAAAVVQVSCDDDGGDPIPLDDADMGDGGDTTVPDTDEPDTTDPDTTDTADPDTTDTADPDTTDADTSDADTTDADAVDGDTDTVDPCEGLPNLCDTAGTACNGDVLETCAQDANGCLVETTMDCNDGAGGFCDDTGATAMCGTDVCFGKTLCDTAGATCDGDVLTTCMADTDGCLVEMQMDCAQMTGGFCDTSGGTPMCSVDPCDGLTNLCATPGTSCAGDVLTTCAQDANGCLVETTMDCNDGAGGFCNAAAPAACDTDPCFGISDCTMSGTTCNADVLETCAADANGCLVTSTVDCAAYATTCDASGAAPVCAGTGCVDEFVGAVEGAPAFTGDNTGAGDDLTGSCNDPSGGLGEEVVYGWIAPQTGCYEIDTEGSTGNTDTLLYILDDCTNQTELACNEDIDLDNFIYTSRVRLDVTADSPYLIVVDGYSSSSVGAFDVNIAYTGPACAETMCSDGNDDDGDGLTDCADPDCASVAGCSEIMCGDTVDDDGDGFVDCQDPDCYATTSCAAVCPNTDLGMATGDGVIVGTNVGAGSDGSPSCGGSGQDVAFTWTAPTSACYIFDTESSDYDTTLAIYDSCGGTELACDNDSGATGTTSTLTVPVTAGEDYAIWVDGYAGATGTFVLDINASPVPCAEFVCDDGADDDADGLTDCADPDCFGAAGVCDSEAGQCGDAVDNDADGYADCLDTECQADASCTFNCGDGTLDSAELCDDGNTTPGDGCDANCRIEGESCAAPIVVTGSTFTFAGTNWDRVADDLILDAASCTERTTGQSELVFQVEVPLGQRVQVRELGTSFDSVISILPGTCDSTTACFASADGAETTGLTYTPTTGTETVFVVVEAYSATETDAYDIRIDLIQAEICGSGSDEDGDGDIDCADSDCFGLAGVCDSEVGYCTDGEDNDADGTEDCLDLDCGLSDPSCTLNCGDGTLDNAEQCDDGNNVDGDGCSSGLCRIEGESCADAVVISSPSFAFAGPNWSRISDDLVLESSCTERTTGQGELVYQVNLVERQRVTARELGSLDSVISILPGTCDGMTACFASSDGAESTGLTYTAMGTETVFVVVEAWSATTTSSYDIRIDVEQLEICDNTVDDDGDGAADCADADCAGEMGCIETMCSDGADDEGDGLIDCADPDCAGTTGCAETMCADTTDDDGDGFVDCADPDCYAATGCAAVCPNTDLGSATGNAVIFGTNVGAGSDGSPSCGGSGQDVAFTWTAPSTACYIFDTESSDYDTTLAIYDSCGGTQLACDNDSGATGLTSTLTVPVTAGEDYAIWVDGYAGATGTFVLDINASPVPCSETACSDGADDDADGLTDCADPDCYGVAGACDVEAGYCTDGVDNDLDGLADCLDFDCGTSDPSCVLNCGDGNVDNAELCDDGNVNAGDGCDANCRLESASCTSPIVVSGSGLTFAGPTWSGVTDDLVLEASCTERTTGQGELVFQVDLLTGQTVTAREFGSSLDSVISILAGTCDGMTACFASSDSAESTGLSYTAAADETIFVVVEAWSDTESDAFAVEIEIVEPELCGSGSDEDRDGLIDCDDPDCFGAAGLCDTSELNCADGADNDGNGLVDCADTTACATNHVCLPVTGMHEAFSSDFDLNGQQLVFTPDGAGGYVASVTASAGFSSQPGSGTVSTVLRLGDSDAQPYAISTAGPVPFYNAVYSTVYVGSNGFVTFGDGDTGSDSSSSAFYAYPRIAPADDDLDPDGGNDGTITVDEFADRVVVTYEAVPVWLTTDLETYQLTMYTQNAAVPGLIVIDYVQVQGATQWVGISSGGTGTTYPAEVDFSAIP